MHEKKKGNRKASQVELPSRNLRLFKRKEEGVGKELSVRERARNCYSQSGFAVVNFFNGRQECVLEIGGGIRIPWDGTVGRKEP